MANKLKSMLQVRRILQLLADGYSKRQVSQQTSVSRNTIDSYEDRFHLTGKSFQELLSMDDGELSVIVYPARIIKQPEARQQYCKQEKEMVLRQIW